MTQPESESNSAAASGVRRITWRTADVIRVLILLSVFVLAWQFFWMVINAFFLGLLAILVAIILHQPARFLTRWMPFAVAFPLVLVIFLGSGGALFVAVVPQLVNQVGQLANELPRAMEAVAVWLEEGPLGRAAQYDELVDTVVDQTTDFLTRFVPFALDIITAIAAGFAVLVLAVFLAAQPRIYRDGALRLVPPHLRGRAGQVFDEAGHSLRNWVIGKACTMIAVGIVTYIGLLAFGIPGALALAALAMVLEFIPNFGPVLAAIPAVIAAFLISPMTALWITVFYIILQQIQSAVTVPLVERRAVNIPPAALLIWQLMLVIGFGFLGLFVATPLLALLAIAVRILYIEPAEEREGWDRRAGSVEPGPIIAAGSPGPPAGEARPRRAGDVSE